MASNFRCAESVSKFPTNSYNLDEAVALKVGFVLYILPQLREIVSVSVVWPIFVYTALVFNISVTEPSYKQFCYYSSKTVRLRYHGNLWDLETLRPLSSALAALGTLQPRGLRVSKSHRFQCTIVGERSERDTIRGNKWKSDIYIFIPPYVTFNSRDWSKSVD